ncbi:death-inducer obliterator 1 isoform X2 [Bombyx mandarina]|uniref:Death-inducer obliterator 1 isoform X2 n=1 Tax=Bombyx mandarina TaxID=7092 RepID=A0A6J2JF81_BOMMA|nr:death-inducer obliterator 1 isoform X2 [Bombyx mandarina]
MSNTVITNYTDLNGPSTKAESSVVVIVNKDGSLSVDQNLLGTLMGTDGTQGAISVVRVGHEGKPDDATDSENEDEKLQHVTLSVDSYYGEPNSIIKYDSGAEMLQSLRIETRENSLIGFQNDHCYTSLTSPSQEIGTHEKSNKSDTLTSYTDGVIEITQSSPVPISSPKSVPSSKKITILEQQIIPKGKKILIKPTESPIILKGNDVLTKTLPVIPKSKHVKPSEKIETIQKQDESPDTSSVSSSGESIPDRDSDSDYKDTKDKSCTSFKVKKGKVKPRILKCPVSKANKAEIKGTPKLKYGKNALKKEIKDKAISLKIMSEQKEDEFNMETLMPTSKVNEIPPMKDISRVVVKQIPKPSKKEKKTPAHVTALLTDMSSLFSTPDVIRRVSTDNKGPPKDLVGPENKKITGIVKLDVDNKVAENPKSVEETDEKSKTILTIHKPLIKQKEKGLNSTDKTTKSYESIPQLDEVSLAQILQDNTAPSVAKSQQAITTSTTMSSPGLVGPLSPTLDLLGSLSAIQPEEEGLTEDLLMHVAQLVESSENLQEVIDKQVLGKVDSVPAKPPVHSLFQQTQAEPNLYTQTLSKTVQKNITAPRKDPIEIVRRDGRVITLPPIEAPATRSSKRKSQLEVTNVESPTVTTPLISPTPEPQVLPVPKQYVNKKPNPKKIEPLPQANLIDKICAESQESWNSEDDPNRLWCICKQPHNNRFMICCDSCEDWFHGKCVNITKTMGQQMEEQGIEWRCPNCIKKVKTTPKSTSKPSLTQKKHEVESLSPETPPSERKKENAGKTTCIVCKKHARASSIYCSDACILKHAQDSLVNPTNQSKTEEETGKSQEKQNPESRVIVYERKSGRLLAGPNAPTAENLKAWIQKNPTFEVVRPGALNTIRPNISKKKTSIESNKIQTTLNFERLPRKSIEPTVPTKSQTSEVKDRLKPLLSPKEEPKQVPQPKTPVTPKSLQSQNFDSPKASGSGIRNSSDKRKSSRNSLNKSQSIPEKAASVTPSTSRKKESHENKSKMNSLESIRENVRKSLQEQMSLRMAENKESNFTEDEIEQFALETEEELHDLFRDVGMKYKAKYRSLMFNIKDRKNLTLWEKICDKTLTPKQLVRLSPEELASQELAEWRDQEAKHQLELIKKSELDLLAANKTYVLKTHKGEEVMETKESVSTELDPNVPVEDVVSVLNDAINEDSQEKEKTPDMLRKGSNKKSNSRKREREESYYQTKKVRRDSEKKSRSSRRRKSACYEKESKLSQKRPSRRSDRKSRSISNDRSRSGKEKSDIRERSLYRSKSKEKSRRRSKSKSRVRSRSKSMDKSRERDRSGRRSRSRSISKRHSSRSKRLPSTEDKQQPRSRSQDNVMMKNKHDSTDSESLERPKSAMLKEVHPEYDPHEPMITSAFSDEDLIKSREDVFEESYKNKTDNGVGYDSSEPISTNVELIKSNTYQSLEKTSEGDSDQEPSSTVDTIPVATVWNGCINMVDVARFYVSAHEVSGTAVDLEEDLPTELDIVGRINPDTVWEYIGKMKKASNKDIIILRLQAANDEEKMPYIALFSYLSSRNRLGVVKVSNTTTVKDFYVVPLPANTTLPPVLMPLDGPGISEVKTHQLLTIVIRQRKKRLASHIPKEVIPAKVARESHKRSYTPPVQSKITHTPPASPRRRNPLPLPSYSTSTLSTSVKDKIAASLVDDDDEAYSPGSSSSGSSATATASSSIASSTLRSKMEELNRQIEEQKQQIRKIAQASSSPGEDEAYSPSRPMTPPAASVVPLADIALPSNLHEILATIKQRSETTTGDVDMRTLPLK